MTIWKPQEKFLDITREIQALETQSEWQPTVAQPATWQPMVKPEVQPITQPQAIVKPEVAPQEPIPFWARALQVFAAPFQWVDENVIKPGLAITGTTIGFVPEVTRQPGEDYFEWKKRSWAGWKAPGIELNVPWSKDPARIDMKGIMEFAPWLLIPGAGQVGGGARVARGVAGMIGKIYKPLGYAIEYSPWGIAEKTAGVAIRTSLKATYGAVSKVSPAIEARVFGKIKEPEVLPVVAKLTTFFKETVVPARVAFEKELPALRAKQASMIESIRKRYRTGEITALEATELEAKATAGGIKSEFAVEVSAVGKATPVTPEVTARVGTRLTELQRGVFAILRGDERMGSLLIEPVKEGLLIRNIVMEMPHTLNRTFLENVEQNLAEVAISKGLKTIYIVPRQGQSGLFTRLGYSNVIIQGKKAVKKSLADIVSEVAIPKAEAGMPIISEAIKFNSIEVEDLLGQIQKATENGFVERDSSIALRDLLMVGTLPEPHNIRDFAKVFGEQFAESVKKLRGLKPSNWERVIDVLNLPRAVLASGDLSATFRQGLILLLTRPRDFPRAFGRQLKAFASEKLSLNMDEVLRSHPLYQSAVNDGVEFTTIRAGARLARKEEPFFSNLAQGLPLVRRSERAFTTFLNEMRMSSYEAAHAAMTAQGASASEFKLMGNFINLASGRGTLPSNLNKYAPVLNTVLFSARYQMSTLQLPRQIGRMLISENPYMRKEAAKALVTFVGGGVGLLGLLKATGKSKVDFDPRSSDFGKVIIGDTRLDIWRGYIQYARFAAQLLMGERKSAYGNINKAQRYEIAWRFIQGKASPAFGLMVDLLKGETYMGEDMLTSTNDAIRAARERLVPLAIQDVIDAMEQNGVNGLWTAAPAIMGVGVLTYINDFTRAKEKIAKQVGYETWDEIDPKTQRMLENSNAELQAAYIKLDQQVMGTAWGDWRLAGKAVDDVFRENVNNAVNQYRETGDGVQFRGKVTDAFAGRRNGYAAREKMPQFEDVVKRLQTQDTAEALVGLGPEQLAIKIYNDALYGDDMYDEYGDYRFEEADIRKEQLRQQLGNDMFNYVEEYQAMKFEDLPPEFQELTKARKVLKPYWQVQDEAIKIFGEPKTQSQLNRLNSFIQRIRKRLRQTNPEIAKAYSMFYLRQEL